MWLAIFALSLAALVGVLLAIRVVFSRLPDARTRSDSETEARKSRLTSSDIGSVGNRGV